MRKKEMIKKLVQVLNHLEMETCDFGENFTDLIKKETKLWRETWVIPPLKEVLEGLKK